MSSRYQYINPSVLMRAIDNDLAFFKYLSETYLEISNPAMNQLQQAVSVQDFKKIAFESHSLKGAALQIGAEHLAKLLSDIEMLALAENMAQINALWEEVVCLFQFVEVEVRDSILRFHATPDT